jgi:hypothetical protein
MLVNRPHTVRWRGPAVVFDAWSGCRGAFREPGHALTSQPTINPDHFRLPLNCYI